MNRYDRLLLSADERKFIKAGVERNIRTDGRKRMQYRELSITEYCCSKSMGSAKVIIGENTVMASIIGELAEPSSNSPNSGLIEFALQWTPDCIPILQSFGRGDLFEEIILLVLRNTYQHLCLDTLCIVEGVKCWKLNVDIFILTLGGGLYDALSFAIKAALLKLKLPNIKRIDSDAGVVTVNISEKYDESWTPKLAIPNIHTIIKVSKYALLDPTFEEERLTKFCYAVSTSNRGELINIFKDGPGIVSASNQNGLFKELAYVALCIESGFDNVTMHS